MEQLTEETVKDFIKEGTAFVQVWSKDCGWCDKQKPVLEKAMTDYPTVKFGAININYTKPGQEKQVSPFRSDYLDDYDGAPILARFENGVRTHLVKKALLSENVLKSLIEGAYVVEDKVKPKPISLEEYCTKATVVELKASISDERDKLDMAQFNISHLRAELARRQNVA